MKDSIRGVIYDFILIDSVTVYGVVRADAEPTYENQRLQLEEIYALVNGPYYAIGDITAVRAMNKAERDFSKSVHVIKSLKAMAFIVKSPLARIIGNLYMGLTGAAVPTAVFTNYEDALDWIEKRKRADAQS